VRLAPDEAARLMALAASGDRRAWESLVDAYSGMIWMIARNHRLGHGDAADVSQTTWLRLLEHIDRLNDPGHVGAWLATTARRESLRVQARSKRTVLVADHDELEPARRGDAAVDGVDAALLLDERREEVRAALARLPERCQLLMRLLMTEPPLSYEEVSAALGMPIGSIGPTRARCLARVRALLDESAGIDGDAVGSP
jgi:RNA polymerase sigma factor (sigma-70 family)